MFLLKNILNFNTIFNDAPQPWQIGFQDSASPVFTGIIELHNTIFFYLIVICIAVFWVLFSMIFYFKHEKAPFVYKYMNHGLKAKFFFLIIDIIINIHKLFQKLKIETPNCRKIV